MAMPVASSTTTSMPMSSATSSSVSSMSMSGMMDMSQMYMVFFTSTTTSLFTRDWTPGTTGQYAGTCIFLIALAVFLRALIVCKSLLEKKCRTQARQRRLITVISDDADSATYDSDMEQSRLKDASTANTSDAKSDQQQQQQQQQQDAPPDRHWRLSVDLPRSALVTVMAGVGYLLMLAVMTMNVGYFFSVLAGVFVGELFLGRFNSAAGHHH